MNLIQKFKLWRELRKLEKEVKVKGFKSIFTSRTLWGIATMLLPILQAKTGLNITEGVINDVFQIGGAILAVYGRVTAKEKLTVTGAPSEP